MLNNYLTELIWETKSFHLTIIRFSFSLIVDTNGQIHCKKIQKTTNLGGLPTLRKQTQTTTIAHYQWWVVGKLFSHL
jgi:hypothetical protein